MFRDALLNVFSLFYLCIGKFKIVKASNGKQYQCDIRVTNSELECSNMAMRAQTAIGTESITVAETTVTAGGSDEGWSTMAGIMTVTERQATHDRLYFVLSGPHQNMNVFYDDISIKPITDSCQQQVMNSNFEDGDSRFWQPTNKNYIDFDISSSGASGSQYSMMIWTLHSQYTGNSLRQILYSPCILEGQEYLISAKFRLLDAADLASGVICTPSDRNVGSSAHCPTITIRGTNCAGNDVEYLFWNEIEFFQWNKDGFNNYNNVFTVDAAIASCEVGTLSFYSIL